MRVRRVLIGAYIRRKDDMTEIEKLEAGLEYCYDDPEVEKRKEEAIIQCNSV